MSLSVRGHLVSSPVEFFERCHSTDAARYVNQLKESKLSSLDANAKKIGTIDATSCLGVCYHTPNGDVYVQHHDGRGCSRLIDLFKLHAFAGSEPVKVHLIGGCTEKDRDGEFKPARYDLLESKHTKTNMVGLIAFWRIQGYKIDVQGWALGEAKTNETLCSDFVADRHGVQLLKPGIAVEKGLVPELGRRTAFALDLEAGYTIAYDSAQGEELHLADAHSQRQAYRGYAKQMREMSEAQIVKDFSTTPELEPPHFAKTIKSWGAFLESLEPVPAKRIPVPQGPVFILQSEAGVLRAHPSVSAGAELVK